MITKKTNYPNSHFWKNRPVLITGGAGFIGSCLTKKLMDFKAKVVVLDLKSSSPILDTSIKKPKFIQGDVRNLDFVKKVLKNYKIDTIFHLAAQTIVVFANKDPLTTLETNINGTYNILEATRQSKRVNGIIAVSSDKAYGEHKNLPYTETTPLQGVNPYDVSKSCADLLCQMYFKTFKVPVCITRPGNVFGEGDINFSRLIPGVIRSIFFNQRPIIRSDGKFLRDYIYIEDVINAHLVLAQTMGKKKFYGQAFNFGTGKPRSVLEVAEKIASLMKKENLNPKILNEAHHEIKYQYLSSKKAKKLLKWKATVSFEKGLKKTIKWYKAYFQKNPHSKKL